MSLLSFYHYTATTHLYTLSLHDALPISKARMIHCAPPASAAATSATSNRNMSMQTPAEQELAALIVSSLNLEKDRKSTRLNSSHMSISYAVFCLKKRKFSQKGFKLW